MRAIDTNVVVRYLTGDHPQQSARARQVVDAEPVFVPLTVMLETEWVLRSAYDFRAADVVRALTAFAGLPTVTVAEEAIMAAALDLTDKGMDFADALHLVQSGHCEGIVTFDARFAKAAKAAGCEGVEIL